jgi:hypothetical protein
MQNKIAPKNMSNYLFRLIRKIFFVQKTRKRVLATLVFSLFTTYFFLGAVTVEATTCPTSGDATISTDCTYDPGTYNLDSLTIDSGATVTVGDSVSPGQVVLNISGDFSLCTTCTITGDGLGENVGEGTGQGADHSFHAGGAGHGGKGGDGDLGTAGGVTYGSVTQPETLGSGGGVDAGSNADGGGALKLAITGTATINGTISMDGNTAAGSGDGGGGAGGSIWVDAGTITGSGTLAANGGISSDDGGGGGGGRVAIHYDVDDSSSFIVEAFGANASGNPYATADGGAGTIYWKSGSADGDLVVKNNNLGQPNWTDQVTTAFQTFDNITIQDGAYYRIPDGFTLVLDSGGSLTGGGSDDSILNIADGGTFDTSASTFSVTNLKVVKTGGLSTVTDLTFSTDSIFEIGSIATVSLTSLTIDSGGTLTHTANSDATGSDVDHRIDLSVTDFELKSGGSIDISGKGYIVSEGTGAGTDNSNNAGGGGHGGHGGNGNTGTAGGASYGSITEPNTLGSGGGYDATSNASGGGAFKVVASGTVTIDGTINADGASAAGSGDGGGGAGGSIWIDAGTITGTSTSVAANGGAAADDGGGGGGGHIAIYYDVDDSSSWAVQAYGSDATGNPYATADGGAGTIYWKQGAADGDLIVTNSTRAHSNVTTMTGGTSQTYDNITIDYGAKFIVPNTYNLTLDSGGTFTSGNGATSGLEIQNGGAFTPTSYSTFTADGINITQRGTMNAVTDLRVTDCTFIYDSDNGTFGAGLTDLTVQTGGIFTQEGTSTISLTNLTVDNSGTLQHSDNSSTREHILDFSATTITNNGDIVVNGLGLDYDYGTGASATAGYLQGSGGAGYGGNGGDWTSTGGATYGSTKQPIHLGSGAGQNTSTNWQFDTNGSNGGGAIKLVVSGTLTNTGTISADGATGYSDQGGGSGGSIWIDADTITGASGSITAYGGAANRRGGGGGGGRIALYYNTDSTSNLTLSAQGGDGIASSSVTEDGGAGTIYRKDKDSTDTNGYLIMDSTGPDDENYSDIKEDLTFDDIELIEGPRPRVTNGYTVTLSAAGTFTTSGTDQSQFSIADGGTFVPTGYTSWTFNGFDVEHDGEISVVTDLTVQDSFYEYDTDTASYTTGNLNLLDVATSAIFELENSSAFNATTITVQDTGELTHQVNEATHVHDAEISVTTLTINSGGAVHADAKGFQHDAGTGTSGQASYTNGNGGAGHGGYGGNGEIAGGASYGSVTQPVTLGSGAGLQAYNNSAEDSAFGGGALKITVSGTLTNNGRISADGGQGPVNENGGGAGGSVWIDANTLSGGGIIRADGADATGSTTFSYTGGGGGGRIAVYYTNGNPWSYSLTAYGGAASFGGGASADNNTERTDGGGGTIYTKQAAATYGDLRSNSGQNRPNYTDITSSSETYDNVTFEEGVIYRIPSGRTLSIATGGSLTGGGTEQAEMLIESGGEFDPNTTNLTVDDLDITLQGNLTGLTDLTLQEGAINYSGTFDSGLTNLTLGERGVFTNSASSDNLFSGSVLDVGSGATYVHDTNNVLGVTTVYVRTNGTITHSDNSTAKDASVYISATDITIETGGAIDVTGYGFDNDLGPEPGISDGLTAGGGGYGGPGEDGGNGGAGGAVYADPDEATEVAQPNEMGSGGGTPSAGTGGAGGGVIRLVVSGTLTNDGSIIADGQDGQAGDSGGGAGGSIWIDADGISCTGGVISAEGGDAPVGVFGGGGSGGGRISITYVSGYAGCTTSILGGVDNTPAGDGTLNLQTSAPTIVSLTVTPSSPNTYDTVLGYVSASYDGGIDKIDLYLDGSPPSTGLVHTCDFSGGPTSAECSYNLGLLARGDHTLTAIVTGDDATTRQQGLAFSVADQTTQNGAHLDRLQVGETDVQFTLDFQLSGTVSGTLQVNFPSGFTVTDVSTANGTCQSGTLSGFAIGTGAQYFTVTQNTCTAGALHIEDVYVDLPSNVDSYEITWSNDNGFGAVAIVDDDQVIVSSNVDPSISFNVGAASSCDHTFAGNGGTVALGTLDTGSVASSDVASVNHICTRMSHNAGQGAVITVRSQYAALRSVSTPSDTIPAVGTTLSAGIEGYGLCISDTGAHHGKDPSAGGTAADPSFTGSDFNTSSCGTTAHQVGLMTTSDKVFWRTASPTQNAFSRAFLKAAISALTEAHDDYTDTLTFIMTATY